MVAGQIVNLVAYAPFNFKYNVRIVSIDESGIRGYDTEYDNDVGGNEIGLWFWHEISQLDFQKSAV